MALKTYGKETLNDNWFEERSSTGVLEEQDIGQASKSGKHRTFSTTNVQTYQRPSQVLGHRGQSKAEQLKRRANAHQQPRCMITLQNFDQSQKPMIPFGQDWSRGGQPPDLVNEKETETSYQHDFGNQPSAASHMAKRLLREGLVRPSGGTGSLRPDRGFAASGASGEIYKADLSDPQRSTKVQRAWMYSMDPMIAVKQQQEQDRNVNMLISPTITAESSAVPVMDSFARKTTSITTVSKHKDGIFSDD